MAILTVTKTDQSKNGKPRVYFGGKNDWKDAYYIGNKCNGVPEVGKTIDANTSSKRFDNAKYDTWFLDSWKPLETNGNGNEHAAQAGIADAQPQARQPIQGGKPPGGWAIDYGDLSRFVSNVVGSAIAAGYIQKPPDMAPWIASAYRALEAVREGKILDFDDEPPSAMRMPDPSEPQGFDDGDPGFADDDAKIPF